ncbi:17389_t:CDS:2, partial [Dentiscutata erythropus]
VDTLTVGFLGAAFLVLVEANLPTVMPCDVRFGTARSEGTALFFGCGDVEAWRLILSNVDSLGISEAGNWREVGIVVFKGKEFSCSCSSAQCAECSGVMVVSALGCAIKELMMRLLRREGCGSVKLVVVSCR